MIKEIKILIIGGGAVSEMFHIPAAISLFGVNGVYVAEPNEIQREKLITKYNLLNVSDDYKKYIDKINFVIVATPPHLHEKIILDCIDFNIPVLCEKPLALTFEECSRIMNANKTKGITIGMCHTYRFFPNRLYAKKLISENYFENNLTINIEEGDKNNWPVISGYNFRKELVPGGVLLDGGIHSLDFILWCLGKPLQIEYIDDAIGGLESNAQLNLKFDKNINANFRISRTCSLPNKIEIKGDFKKIELDIFEMTKINLSSKINFLETDKNAYNWSTIAKYQIEDFLSAIKNKTKPMCDVAEGAHVVEIIEKCYKIKKQKTLPEKAPIPGMMF